MREDNRGRSLPEEPTEHRREGWTPRALCDGIMHDSRRIQDLGIPDLHKGE